LIEALPDCFPPSAPDGTVEKMLRLASFVALIIAGLRDETQPLIWISDHDEALGSNNKREHFAKLATYLTFGLTKWKAPADNIFGTTEIANAPYWSEDLAAIPDLIAGTYCNIAPHIPTFLNQSNWALGFSSSVISDSRAQLIGNWLAKGSGFLKQVLLRLESSTDGSVRSSAQTFMRH
jgi:hypothetical protein